MDKAELLGHIDALHTTDMGIGRIRRNLGLGGEDVVAYCKALILRPDAAIVRRGKNWYVTAAGVTVTVNASSHTIITAHRIR